MRGDLRTGRVRPLVAARDGGASLGMKVDARGRLWVAGGTSRRISVYGAGSGRRLASWQVAPQGTAPFLNDVVLGPRAAYVTDSAAPRLWVVPRDRRGAPGGHGPIALALTGDLAYDDDPGTIELNGIVSSRFGRALVAVQSRTGLLFRIDPATGATTQIALRGGPLPNGDGLLLRGRELFVVQNRLNRVAVVSLTTDLRSGTVKRTITDGALDVPTTLAGALGALWTVNARFGVSRPATRTYDVVRLKAG